VLLYRLRCIRVWRDGFDLVELGNQIGKSVIVILVCVNREQPVEACTQYIKIALGSAGLPRQYALSSTLVSRRG
jgi:hypothetical protein